MHGVSALVLRGLPCGPVIKSRFSNAENVGSTRGWRARIPHDMGQLSSCACLRQRKILWAGTKA